MRACRRRSAPVRKTIWRLDDIDLRLEAPRCHGQSETPRARLEKIRLDGDGHDLVKIWGAAFDASTRAARKLLKR